MITVVVGGQYGGEGKGKVAAYLAHKEGYHIACRCGGPNSSHTVVWQGRAHRLRMMPTAAVIDPEIDVWFGAGTLIHIETLLGEIQQIGYRGKLRIDRNAGVVTDDIVTIQRQDQRYLTIGSTMTGTGYASAMRCMRKLRLASEFPELARFSCDLTPFLISAVTKKRRILVEGHQGYSLSNYHGDYPYTSSRDSTAGSMLAEIGLGPLQKGLRIILVAKMFPTRNHQGELSEELPLEDADKIGIYEYGGGSWGLADQRRRVGLINFKHLERAIFANSATEIAVTGIDYYDHTLRSATRSERLTREVLNVVNMLGRNRVRYLSTGADTDAMIDLFEEKSAEKRTSKTLDLWSEH